MADPCSSRAPPPGPRPMASPVVSGDDVASRRSLSQTYYFDRTCASPGAQGGAGRVLCSRLSAGVQPLFQDKLAALSRDQAAEPWTVLTERVDGVPLAENDAFRREAVQAALRFLDPPQVRGAPRGVPPTRCARVARQCSGGVDGCEAWQERCSGA